MSQKRFFQQLLRSGAPHEDNASIVLFNPYLHPIKSQKSPFMFYGRSQCHGCTQQALPFQHNATGQESKGIFEDEPAGSPPSTRGRSFLVSEFPRPYSQRQHLSIFYDVKVKLGNVGWDLFSERISGDFLPFVKWILYTGLSLCCHCFTDTVHYGPTKTKHHSTKRSLITRTVPAPEPLTWLGVCTTNRAHDEQTRAGNTINCYRLLMLLNGITQNLRIVLLELRIGIFH